VSLGLRAGLPVWVLVKSVSIRGHAFMEARHADHAEAIRVSLPPV
jgi:hypothetical protein